MGKGSAGAFLGCLVMAAGGCAPSDPATAVIDPSCHELATEDLLRLVRPPRTRAQADLDLVAQLDTPATTEVDRPITLALRVRNHSAHPSHEVLRIAPRGSVVGTTNPKVFVVAARRSEQGRFCRADGFSPLPCGNEVIEEEGPRVVSVPPGATVPVGSVDPRTSATIDRPGRWRLFALYVIDDRRLTEEGDDDEESEGLDDDTSPAPPELDRVSLVSNAVELDVR